MKRMLYFIAIVVLVLTLLPARVFAAAPQNLDLKVRNQTGGEVELRVTGTDGVPKYFSLPAGTSTLTLTEGVYEYYAILPCGFAAGTWNVNVVKILYLSCSHDMVNVLLVKAMVDCYYWGSWDYNFDKYLAGYWSAEPDFYLGFNPEGFGMRCLDTYMEEFYSIPGWQLWDADFGLIAQDPDFY